MITDETWRAVAYDLDLSYEELREKIAYVDHTYEAKFTSDINYYFDWDGDPITLGQWAILFESPAYRFIRTTTLPAGERIMTVWFGHRDDPTIEPPQIFETGVFPGDSGPPRYRELHTSLGDAHTAHDRIVIEVANQRL